MSPLTELNTSANKAQRRRYSNDGLYVTECARVHIHTQTNTAFFFLRWSLALLPRLECSGTILVHSTSTSWVQAILLPQPPEQLGITGTRHHGGLIFVFLVELGFHHLHWTPAGITGVSRHAWPQTSTVCLTGSIYGHSRKISIHN